MRWQRVSRFIACLLLLSATACGQGPDDNLDAAKSNTPSAGTDDRTLEGAIVIDDDVDKDTALEESDPYELHIDGEHKPVIENDTLTLTVSYGGGCEKHDFTLVTDRNLESDSILTLIHDANDDRCEAYPTNRYAFDLTPLKTLYQKEYETDEGSVTLRLRHLLHPRHSGEPGVLRLDYTFAP